MSSIAALIGMVCVCSIAVSALGIISPKGVTSKTLNLVIGVFIICVMIIPIKSFINDFKTDFKAPEISESLSADAQNSYKEAVIDKTKSYLEQSLLTELLNKSFEAQSVEFDLSENSDGGIYIKGINIYINKTEKEIQKIISLTEENFKTTPRVIMRQK